MNHDQFDNTARNLEQGVQHSSFALAHLATQPVFAQAANDGDIEADLSAVAILGYD